MRRVYEGFLRGPDVLRQLDLDGQRGLVASDVVIFLQRFGEIAPATPALKPLLNQLLEDIGGGEDADFVRGLFVRYPLDRPVAQRPRLVLPFDPSGREVKEAMLSPRSLLEIVALKHALDAARAVVHVDAPGGLGTGFMVTPTLLLTNNHVIGSVADAAATSIWFGFEHTVDDAGKLVEQAGVRVSVRTGGLFVTSPALDYTMVEIDAPADFGKPLPLRASPPRPGDYAMIIQHPLGKPKKIALRDNVLVYVAGDALYYTTSTDDGSSGSPVLDDDFRVVALHRAWDSFPTGAGGGQRVNLGTSMKAILSDLEQRAADAWKQLDRR